ncbi:hypothetical protein NPIL_625661 [Nephila pilipes]|uniref:Uncharacterized protein n=1 Tax=Nephila pilipes TaxID=299642 RepID=A0A8X6PSW3_NEPPI|nr:hypothetical protein NPIL_625661 [Nephila pilipes]
MASVTLVGRVYVPKAVTDDSVSQYRTRFLTYLVRVTPIRLRRRRNEFTVRFGSFGRLGDCSIRAHRTVRWAHLSHRLQTDDVWMVKLSHTQCSGTEDFVK